MPTTSVKQMGYLLMLSLPGVELVLPDGRAPIAVTPKPQRIASSIKIFGARATSTQYGGKWLLWSTDARRIFYASPYWC